MGDALAKFLRFSPLDIHMMWIEVAGLSCVQYDVSFGDGAPQCLALITQLVVFKISLLEHSGIPPIQNILPAYWPGCQVGGVFATTLPKRGKRFTRFTVEFVSNC